MNLIDLIKKHEGFNGMPYNDSLDIPTIGYGTKLPLDEEESELLLKHRLNKKINELIELEPFYKELPQTVRVVIADMAYQLGVGGVLKFKKMWSALKNRDYQKASEEMLDSKWAKQTPKRAKELAEIIRKLG
jgi:lysozyme